MKMLENHLIDVDAQNVLTECYEITNYQYINAKRPLGFPESKSYIFNLYLIKDYIEYVEKKSSELGLNDVEIAICMGKYPDDEFDERLDPIYKGYQTVFFRAGEFVNEEFAPILEIEALNFGTLSPPH